jgi:hypothetical protein
VSTAPAVLTAAPVDVHGVLKFQNDCLRTRNYEAIGRIQRIVFEVTSGMYIPPELAEDLKSDPMGPCIEFFGQENWLPIAQVKAAGQQDFLLPLAPVKRSDGYIGFPDKPDRHWVPTTGPETKKITDPKTGEVSYKMVHEAPRMLKQDLRNFSTGILRGTNFIVYERVAQILVKPTGLAEGWILNCRENPADQTHMTFLLDHKTGQSHFYGGQYEITRPGVS